ncbi:MAG: SDR family oxidoreductase [Myxococcota bacterium]
MSKELRRTALITGASQGLGRALMLRLAAQGWPVAGVARSEEALQDVVSEVPGALAVAGDVADPGAAARIVGAVQSQLGPIELLVHAASTLGPTPLRPLLDLTEGDFDRVLEVNLAAPFRLTRLVAGAMALRGRGTVVFVSSDAAVEAYPTWGAYGVSKAGLDHLARIWAAEVPEVRFIAVDPGEMDTAMHAAAMPDADPSTLARPEAVAEGLLRQLGDWPTGGRVEVQA